MEINCVSDTKIRYRMFDPVPSTLRDEFLSDEARTSSCIQDERVTTCCSTWKSKIGIYFAVTSFHDENSFLVEELSSHSSPGTIELPDGF